MVTHFRVGEEATCISDGKTSSSKFHFFYLFLLFFVCIYDNDAVKPRKQILAVAIKKIYNYTNYKIMIVK